MKLYLEGFKATEKLLKKGTGTSTLIFINREGELALHTFLARTPFDLAEQVRPLLRNEMEYVVVYGELFTDGYKLHALEHKKKLKLFVKHVKEGRKTICQKSEQEAEQFWQLLIKLPIASDETRDLLYKIRGVMSHIYKAALQRIEQEDDPTVLGLMNGHRLGVFNVNLGNDPNPALALANMAYDFEAETVVLVRVFEANNDGGVLQVSWRTNNGFSFEALQDYVLNPASVTGSLYNEAGLKNDLLDDTVRNIGYRIAMDYVEPPSRLN